MPVIRNGEEARECMLSVVNSSGSLPCFCTESVYTTEAIFKGVSEYKRDKNIQGRIPLIIAFTASYADRQQLKNYTGLGDFREGILAVKSDIERLARKDGPYSEIDVIVHLDHAQPGADTWIVEEFSDFISSVMWDCSHYSLIDNIRMMADFRNKYQSSFIIEGAVDEIYNYEANNQRGVVIDNITSAEMALEYYQKTGVDLLVANLGTEHRRTEGTVEYHRKEANEISRLVGRRLVLHGTSSLNENDLQTLNEDGIVKVNLWGKLESVPGQALVEKLLRELEHQLPTEKIKELVATGYLDPRMQNRTYKPSIHYLTEKYRRDEVYLPVVSQIVKQFYTYLY
jgi:fructose/tagatose bisphosphate aldolase